MAYTDTIERVAVTDSKTVMADRVRYMSGEAECSLYEIDEPWDFRKESLEDFCRRNVNYGQSETIEEKDIDKRFEEISAGHEYDRYALVLYTDVYTEDDGAYTVNNVSREGKIFAPRGASNDDLLDILKENGLFNKTYDNKAFNVSGDDMLAEIETDEGYPLCRLEKEETPIREKKTREKKSPKL